MAGDPKVDQRTRRIQWARGMTNDEIADVLQAKLMEARAEKASTAPILLELIHEIKHRLSVTNYTPRTQDE